LGLETELLTTIASRAGQTPGPGHPLRDLYLPSLQAARSYPQRVCAGGPVCLTAIARADAYLLLTQRRSNRVLNVTGRLAIIPKGFHQPTDGYQADPSLATTIRRELEEELLGRQDLEQLTVTSQRLATRTHPRSLTEPARSLLDHPNSHSIKTRRRLLI
jgi:hypothetical protein